MSWKKQIPMWLTYGRIFLVFPFVYFMTFPPQGSPWPAAWIFIISALTDALDGWAARKLKAESTAGKILDPAADKILVHCALILLLWLERVHPFLIILLLIRDFLINSLRTTLASEKKKVMTASLLGKWKTAFQMIAIPCLILYDPSFFLDIPLELIGTFCLWTSVVLSWISGFGYIFSAKSLTTSRKRK